MTLHIIESPANPDGAPTAVGQHWLNTTDHTEFRSYGTSDVSDWVAVGAGAGGAAGVEAVKFVQINSTTLAANGQWDTLAHPHLMAEVFSGGCVFEMLAAGVVVAEDGSFMQRCVLSLIKGDEFAGNPTFTAQRVTDSGSHGFVYYVTAAGVSSVVATPASIPLSAAGSGLSAYEILRFGTTAGGQGYERVVVRQLYREP